MGGALRYEEFETHINDEKIKAYLHTLELDVTQIKLLFKLLDTDQGGEVDLQEFVSGCIKLKGGAKTLDLAFLKYQADFLVTNMESLRRFFESQHGQSVPEFPSSPPLSMAKNHAM